MWVEVTERSSEETETETGLPEGHWLRWEDYQQVSDEDIRVAVRSLTEDEATHGFAESTTYDVVLDDGTRLAPKAVLGLAARAALGIEVLPKHFLGGVGTPCFRAIAAAGFEIKPKKRDGGIPTDPGDEWVEGEPQRVRHLRYERNSRAAHEKKKTFREDKGHLACEECGIVPVDEYDAESGEACIEYCITGCDWRRIRRRLVRGEHSTESLWCCVGGTMRWPGSPGVEVETVELEGPI